MNFSDTQEAQLQREAKIVIVAFLSLFAASLYYAANDVYTLVSTLNTIRDQNKNSLAINEKQALENKFFRDNQAQIETMWGTLKSISNGIAISQMGAFTQIGFNDHQVIPPSRAPGSTTDYNGLRLNGNRAEFQRVLDALATIEAQNGLLQIKSATFTLPSTTTPNNIKPTYVQTTIELVAPNR